MNATQILNARAKAAAVDPRLLARIIASRVPPRGRLSPTQVTELLADLEHVVLPAPEPESLGEGEPRHTLPPATDLPTSLSWEPNPEHPGGLIPVYPPGFKDPEARDDGARAFIRSKGGRCELCGRRKGDPYPAADFGDDGMVIRVTRLSRGPQACHRTNDPARVAPKDLVSGCPQCHGNSERGHRQGSGALTAAAEPGGTRLTEKRIERVLGLIRRDAMDAPNAPLASMGVGGIDFLCAVAMHKFRGVQRTHLARLIPELWTVPQADLDACVQAARRRLDMRGLLKPSGVLSRPLALPADIVVTPPCPYGSRSGGLGRRGAA